MAQVRELFSELFAYVLLFEQLSQQGDFQPAYHTVRNDITSIIGRLDAGAERHHLLDQSFQNARFAAIAWTDEQILKQLGWAHHGEWARATLQFEYYNTRNAGEEFFERLEGLPPDQHEIREVFYLCLGLGFSGRYHEDAATLNGLRHNQAAHLAVPLEELPSIDKITPQPYEVAAARGRPITPPITRLLLRIALALLVSVPLGLLLVYLLTDRPSSPPPPSNLAERVRLWLSGHQALLECAQVAPQVDEQGGVIQLAGRVVNETQRETIRSGLLQLEGANQVTDTFQLAPDPACVKRDIQQWLAGHQDLLACAKVATTFDPQSGTVALTGRVASTDQQDKIRSGLRSITGVDQIAETVQLIPRPFCLVVDLLEPFKAFAEAGDFGLAMRLNQPGERPRYANGNNLIIDVRTPTSFASHLYVDYYTADRSVGHLFPNPVERQNAFAPDGSVTVGKIGGLQWKISAPFGLELVTVIASKTPLFEPPRFDPETAEDYITELRRVLDTIEAADVATTFQFIFTSQ